MYGPKNELLQTVSLDRARELLDSGQVIAFGTRKRIHQLFAPRGSEEFLRATRPPRGKPDTLRYETDDNPRGVWSFRKQHWTREQG